MKVIKILSKKNKNKEGKTIDYFKYMINLPKDIIEESKFEGKELEANFKEGKIIITKK